MVLKGETKMKTKTFEDMLTKRATKQDLKDLIKMAKNEIKEWRKFIKLCRSKKDK